MDHPMKKTRLFLACADERLKIALLMLLDQDPNMVVAGVSDRLQGLLSQIVASQPDALIFALEESLPVTISQIANIHNLAHPPVIICLSNKEEQEETILGAGADYFILTNAPPDELISILDDLSATEIQKQNHNII
jgi:DNA-binding NarL/FixJ family response regulator